LQLWSRLLTPRINRSSVFDGIESLTDPLDVVANAKFGELAATAGRDIAKGESMGLFDASTTFSISDKERGVPYSPLPTRSH